jgi:hypothetical protein
LRIWPKGHAGLSLNIGGEFPDGLMVLRLRPHFERSQAGRTQPRAVRGYAGF